MRRYIPGLVVLLTLLGCHSEDFEFKQPIEYEDFGSETYRVLHREMRYSKHNPDAMDALRRAARYTRAARQGMRRAIGAEVPERPPEQAAALAERAVEDLAVEARASDDPKCPRCWRLGHGAGSHEGHPDLCTRCAGVMDVVGSRKAATTEGEDQ